MKLPRNPRYPAGYTLVEMLLVIAIVATLAVMVAPPLSSALQNNRISTQSNALIGTLQFARTEAVRRGSAITVCGSATGLACGGNWQEGWIVLSGSTLLKAHPKPGGGNTLRFNLSSGAASNQILFNSRGFSPNHAGAMTLCDPRGTAFVHGILLAATGRVLPAPDANGDGIPEDASGNGLSCP
ncbi:MAG: GspH/FimT family pseudopilin [Magnetococcales bacterium]|nr:GspH/FimT family pseudopilin [Magnetococcales bacterium]